MNERDRVLEAFLQRQLTEGLALAQESDLLEVTPVTPQHFAVELRCKGLVRNRSKEIVPASLFTVGVFFPSDYLRRVNPFQVVTWLGPREAFHPNISSQAPLICIGNLTPATPLTDIIHQVFEIITYQKVTMREDDALNPEACAWARRNQNRFPVDDRPLKRRHLEMEVEVLGNTKDQ